MKSKNVSEGLSAVSSLVDMGSSSPRLVIEYLFPMLPQLLKDKNTQVRTRTAFILSGLILTLPDLRRDLVKHTIGLLKHKDPAMRLYAASLLGRIASDFPEDMKNFIREITELLREKDQLTIFVASNTLGEIGFRNSSFLEDVVPTMNELLEQKVDLIVQSFSRISLRYPLLVKDSVQRLIDITKITKDLFMGLEVSLSSSFARLT